MINFNDFFKSATNFEPYDFQRKFACETELPDIINIPTGLGKTECVIIGWLWRKTSEKTSQSNPNTPRRLIYSLPMRTLVEQIYDKVNGWIQKLNLENEFTVVSHSLLVVALIQIVLVFLLTPNIVLKASSCTVVLIAFPINWISSNTHNESLLRKPN